MKLKILTREKLLVDQDVTSVLLPSSAGEMQVLVDHAAAVILLRPGRINYGDSFVAVEKGVVRILGNEILALVEVPL